MEKTNRVLALNTKRALLATVSFDNKKYRCTIEQP